MTVETITEAEYEEKVTDLAEIAAEEAREEYPESTPKQRDALLDTVFDVLDAERWFTHHGPAAHGCIVEHQMHDTFIDPGLYQSDEPEESIKRLAFEVTRHDVLAEAGERL